MARRPLLIDTGEGWMIFLSDEWIRARAAIADELPEVEGLDITIQHTVLDVPGEGTVTYVDRLDAGRLHSSWLGTDEQPDVTLIYSWADEFDVIHGFADPTSLLMDGRVTILGDQGRLLDLLPTLQSELIMVLADRLAEITDPPAGSDRVDGSR